MMPFKSGERIATECKRVLEDFVKDHPKAKELAEKAEGVLVFPGVVKAGMGIGGEYGEGSLKMKDEWKYFYSLLSISYGFQFGAQVRKVLIFFMTKDALKEFNSTAGWKVGVDASITVVTLDAGLNLDSNELLLRNPILAVVTDRKGLMYSLSLEGSKITRIVR